MTGAYIDHGWRHRPGATDPIGGGPGAAFEIKVVGDDMTVAAGDGQFKLAIPQDLDGIDLTAAHAYITTVSSSGVVTVQIHNFTQAVDMLTTPITIDVGEKTSYDPDFPPTTPPVIDTANATVAQGDELWVDVDVAGTGAMGLGVILVFGSPPGGSGLVGPPGEAGPAGPTGPAGADATGAVNVDTIWDAKGDLAAGTGANTSIRLPVGSNGQVLVADSTQTAGVKWDTPTAGAADGWTTAGETWTYATAATFTVAGDVTAKYGKGARLKWTQTTVKYGVVAGSVHSAGTTTVTIAVNTDHVLANAAISANSYSYEVSPQGYPGAFAYTPTATGLTAAPTVDYAYFSIVGNVLSLALGCYGTSNTTAFTVTAPVACPGPPANFPFMPCTINNGSVTAIGRIYFSSTTVLTVGSSITSDTFSSSLTKGVWVLFHYKI